ncbi:MAG: heme exporter protein CcmD [Pelagibacterium sp. SCN 64-44]|nr:MAG: heme exporter protein CcmD [Pelagibacterium sp. SCN 64-44]
MIDLGPHAGFILAAYGGVALALFGVIAWTLLDARSVTRKLARLEAARPSR